MSELVILYSCAGCGLRDAELAMPYRESDEDVITWMETKVRRALGDDHARRSPSCRSEKCDLKIHAPAGTQWLGGPVQQ